MRQIVLQPKWLRAFEQHLNAGDLEGLLALYEPAAQFVTPTGETLEGRERIRPVLAGLIASKTQMKSHIVKAVTAGDIAQLYTDFEGNAVDALGKSVRTRHQAIEVLRRQPDGSWKLIIGDPNGRGMGPMPGVFGSSTS